MAEVKKNQAKNKKRLKKDKNLKDELKQGQKLDYRTIKRVIRLC